MFQSLNQEDLAVPVGNYSLLLNQVLGRGANAIVYRGTPPPTLGYGQASEVAIKAISLASLRDDVTRSLLENEKSALKMVSSPQVVRLLDIVEDRQYCYLVTELCAGGTLKKYIEEKGKLTEEESLEVFRKILVGSNSINQSCVLHRDLKPSNIILREKNDPVIIDFGFCEIIRAKQVMRTFNVGSPSYMAPEAYLKTLYS